jgi:hypothetical protein
MAGYVNYAASVRISGDVPAQHKGRAIRAAGLRSDRNLTDAAANGLNASLANLLYFTGSL